jgi:UDP-GlcNAc:undecaprenyl-phosphate GlcNAc-1-phosphate transferase
VTGTRAQIFGQPVLDGTVTVLWVVGVVNAFNLLDNMDGLSAGVAAIASLATFVVALINGQFLVATLALALVGCALGFLRHNFFPARIYMGDAGSLYLGYLLAVLALRLRTHLVSRISFVVPILILGVAIFDTGLVTTTRLIHRRPVLQGARDHTSHRLVFLGLPVPVTVAVIYGAGVALGWLAIIAAQLKRPQDFLILGLVLAIGLVAGCLLGAVPVYETSQRRRMMLREVLPYEESGGGGDGPNRTPADPGGEAGDLPRAAP